MICATRTLTLATDGGEVAVVVRVDAPYLERDAWACEFEIGWPDAPVRQAARGFDSIQALNSALQMIAVYLYASEAHSAGRLRWGKEGGYGFPMPKLGRADLVGIDIEMFG